ncbi:MAG: YfiR family protein [Desulfococcaceae bacterium]
MGNLIREYARLVTAVYLFAGKTLLLMGIVHLGLCTWAGAEELSGAEYRVKAGFIYHFARFTQWPSDTFADEESPILLCVAAESGADILLPLHSKMIRKRRIEVLRYREPEEAPTVCHILFVTASEEALFPVMPQGPVLTIGETEEFGKKGGIIRFFMEKDRLRFSVNLKAARRAGLQLSSQLLMSAEIATEAP